MNILKKDEGSTNPKLEKVNSSDTECLKSSNDKIVDIFKQNTKNYIHGGHAYAIKKLNYGKEVILSDPHYSNYEIKIPWQIFTEEVMDITYSFKDTKNEQQFKKNALPPKYEYDLKKSQDNFDMQLCANLCKNSAKHE